MTRQEQYLADQRAKKRARIEALAREDKVLAAAERTLQRKRTTARYIAVGKLVEQAGLLDVDDACLADAFKKVAEWLAWASGLEPAVSEDVAGLVPVPS